MLKRYLNILTVLLVLCTTAPVSACSDNNKPDDNNTEQPDEPGKNEPGTNPGKVEEDNRQSLLDLFNGLIEEQDGEKPRKKVFVVAHRANSYAANDKRIPENSVPAIKKAIELGIDMVELDVRPTKDGVYVLMHDETIDATTNGTGKVSDYTYEELMQFNMTRAGIQYKENGQPVKIPTLKEALEAAKNHIYVNLDIDGKEISAGVLVDIIKECGMENAVMIYMGNDPSFAGEFQREDPKIAVHPFILDASALRTFYKSMKGAKLFQYPNSYVWDSADGGNFAKQVRQNGGLSYTNILWTYDLPSLSGASFEKQKQYIDKFILSETDFVQTDYGEVVIEYLKSKGLR